MKVAASEDGATQLLKLIKAVPNLKFKLTPEQELMISTPHNLLCLGRSGTGKTTSSALRLFATEAFYKYYDAQRRFKLENPSAKNKDFKVEVEFLHKSSGVKLLFVSASPVLTNEVKRFSAEFKEHFTQELKRARQKGQPENPEPGRTIEFKDYIEMEIKALEQEEILDQQKSLAHSLDQLKNEDFPLFLTVKRLLYMIDASTSSPFFPRDAEGNQIGMDTNVQWHNESGGVLMINQYHRHGNALDQRIEELGIKMLEYSEKLESGQELPQTQDQPERQGSRTKETNVLGLGDMIDVPSYSYSGSMVSQGQNLSFEVDYDMFKTKFWPKVTFKTQVTPLVAWTEICSEIKGRFDSWQHPYGGLPDNMYIKFRARKNHFLEPEERYQIYRIFLLYEKWKQQIGAYDLNDLVNHIMRQVRSQMLRPNQKVHFLMVDEVQDLTQNIISLFMMLAEKNVFFSGDTAQTIAKGVGFRFFDLKTVFSKQQDEYNTIQVPKVLQLAKNFRSHAQILDLANSVVSLLELIFPRTIDKLVKESSESSGPKPIVIDELKDIKALAALLEKFMMYGSQRDFSFQNQEGQQFGATQVVIVRNQEAKSQIPEFMKDMLCLTVYEAKGLEFDDVILYNFFNDSTCAGQWKLLNEVVVQQTRIRKVVREAIEQFDMLECDEPALVTDDHEETTINTQSVQAEGDTEVTTILKLKSDRNFIDTVHRKFSQVCTELKLLYVAITRPKNFLLIFDQDCSQRKPLQEYWLKQNLIDFVSKQMAAEPATLPAHIQDALRMINNPESEAIAQNELSQQEIIQKTWQLQGLKLFRVKYYRAAAQCFQKLGDPALVKRCNAYEAADRASALKGQHDQKIAQVKDARSLLTKAERKSLRQEAKMLIGDFQKEMMKAGELFCEINMNQHAAQCFFSAGNLANSADLFIKQGKPGPAAECFYKLGQIKKAATYYSEARLFTSAIQCYEQLEDWDGLIQCLYKYKDQYGTQEKQALLEKYFPIALNSVYQMYSQMMDLCSDQHQGILTEENKGKLQQLKLKLKFQRSVSVIKEDEESSSSSAEEEVISHGSNHIIECSESALEEKIDTEQEGPSFVIIDESVQESRVEQNRDLELELLSNIDPEDEFLNSSKSFQIIESVSLNDTSFCIVDASAQSFSDYSIVGGSAVHSAVISLQSLRCDQHANESAKSSLLSLSRVSVIDQQQRDDFANDIALQKVIYYISMFETEVKQHLALASDPLSQAVAEQAKSSVEGDDNLEFMLIELDELSENVIELVLATLQHYEMYRMCLMLCSRLNLTQKIGQFVSAISDKYSNLSSFRVAVSDKFPKPADVQAQQKYSVLAHEAVQNVLKFSGQANQSQIQVWLDKSVTSLFLQGYWKKLVYTTTCETSIQLTWAMSDFEGLKLQYLVQKARIQDPVLLQTLLKSSEDFSKVLESTKLFDSKIHGLVQSVRDEEEALSTISKLLAMTQGRPDCKAIDGLLARLVDKQYYCRDCFKSQELPDRRWIREPRTKSFYAHLKTETEVELMRSAMFTCKLVSQLSVPKEKLAGYVFQKRFGFLLETHGADILWHALTFLQKGLSGDFDLLKVVFKAYGISLIDDLDIFGALQANYCIVNADSVLFAEILRHHELSLHNFKIDLLTRHLCEEYASTGSYQDVYTVFSQIKQKVQNEYSKLSAKEQLDYSFALVCDLNLARYLVPKEWAKQCLIRHMLLQVELVWSAQISDSAREAILLAQHICTGVVKGTDDPFYAIQKQASQSLQVKGKFYDANQFQVLYKQTFNQEPKVCQSTDPIGFQTILQSLQKLTKAAAAPFFRSTWNSAQVQKKPVAYAYPSSPNHFHSQLLMVSLGDWQLRDQIKPKSQPDFFFRLFKQFTAIDASLCLIELRKNWSGAILLDDLLASHAHAKCNNLNESANSLLRWIGAVFGELSFTYFHAVVQEAFAKAWFSYQIYRNKEGKVTLPPHLADCVSEKLRFGDPSRTQQLQDIRIASGNMKTVKLALTWVECFLNNLGLYDGWPDHLSLFQLGIDVVRTVLIADLTSEELKQVREKVKLILQATLKRFQYSQKSSNAIFDLVSGPFNQKKTQELQGIFRKEMGDAITFQLADRKKIAQIVNQIELDVQSCHSNLLDAQLKLLAEREQAAKKICKFVFSKVTRRRQDPESKLFKARLIYKQGLLPLFKTRSVEGFRDLLEFHRKTVHFACSNISSATVDREAALSLAEKLSHLTSQVLSSGAVNAKVQLQVSEEKRKFDVWLLQIQTDKTVGQQSVEAERRRFRKREKWDTVIQFHQKKKIMLKHFKSTLEKKSK